jgi:hypothetical protein
MILDDRQKSNLNDGAKRDEIPKRMLKMPPKPQKPQSEESWSEYDYLSQQSRLPSLARWSSCSDDATLAAQEIVLRPISQKASESR